MLPVTNRNQLRSIFDDLFRDDPNLPDWDDRNDMPAVNISSDEKQYEIEVAAPGLKKKDFDLSVENGNLVISSEQKKEDKKKEKHFVRREFHYSSFRRSFALPDDADADGIKAHHDGGILKVEIPKKPEAQPRMIDIS